MILMDKNRIIDNNIRINTLNIVVLYAFIVVVGYNVLSKNSYDIT
jgi:hypothetical protein